MEYTNAVLKGGKVKCPDCDSPSWYRQKKSGVFVCRKCGKEYHIIDVV